MTLTKILVGLLLLLFPTFLVSPVLRLLGYRIGSRVSIGFSFLLVDQLVLGNEIRIGHFNLIHVRRLIMCDYSHISRSNIVNGPLSLYFDKSASIGNRNKILRAPSPSVVAWGAVFKLENGARITSDHLIDCTRSVSLGEHSILAGSGTQIWTHGYIHSTHGSGRYRIDGSVNIANNVYIGSRCIINPGISIASASILGAGTTVSRSILKSGFYVSSSIRRFELPISPNLRDTLFEETSDSLCEKVYLKRN